jgi:hypothetical protein
MSRKSEDLPVEFCSVPRTQATGLAGLFGCASALPLSVRFWMTVGTLSPVPAKRSAIVVSVMPAARRVVVFLFPVIAFAAPSSAALAQGPYDPASGPGSLGIPAASPLFVGWATGVPSLIRGPQNISTPGSPLATFGTSANALGPSDNTVVSLGDGGSITLSFAAPIVNGPGPDFAVFENGFLSGSNGMAFLELGHVEVSSNGVDFVRFPSVSLTQTTTQVGGFGLLDSTNIHNLAGKHVAGLGTPFDLNDVAGNALVNVNDVTEVRITDVVGSIDPAFGSRDSLGNLINDPFPTPSASGGFDLDAVGVVNSNAVPEPSSFILMAAALGGAAAWRRRTKSDNGVVSPFTAPPGHTA